MGTKNEIPRVEMSRQRHRYEHRLRRSLRLFVKRNALDRRIRAAITRPILGIGRSRLLRRPVVRGIGLAWDHCVFAVTMTIRGCCRLPRKCMSYLI